MMALAITVAAALPVPGRSLAASQHGVAASNGIGGDLFALVYVAKEDKLYGLNGSGWSPLGMTLEFLKGKGVEGELPYRGVYTVTVPGAVAGWAALHQRFARLPLATDLAPAIWYARSEEHTSELQSQFH